MEPVATAEHTTEDSPITRMTTTEAKDNFEDTVNRVADGEERVILNQDGKDVAAIISLEEFWFLERAIRKLEDEMDLEAVRAARTETETEENISLEELKKELGL